eukprot:jgi/Hompol1/4998/HPOL_001100-RA
MSRQLHVLIIDEVGASTVNSPTVYSDFVDPAIDNMALLLITNSASQQDKNNCLAVVELSKPTCNGLVEVWAQRLHQTHRIDIVYTKQEDLILRAAHIREMLGVAMGHVRSDALLFRDKYAMKDRAQLHGFPVPAFDRVFSPVDILQFVEIHGFPIILKPVLGSASAGVRVVRDQQDLETYLEKEFYGRIDDIGMVMDYSGDIIVEKFLEGSRMYHVNGYVNHGQIEHIWPFMYLQTNLEFTKGKAYGNVSIPQTDPRWQKLYDATLRLLSILPLPAHLLFHLELFETKRPSGQIEFVLCEIAARRPGGSIALLIDALEGGHGIFPEMEFRLNVGLPLRQTTNASGSTAVSVDTAVGDLMIPKKLGTLIALPDAAACPVGGVVCKIFGKIGSVYKGFDMATLNTCARLVASGGFTSTADVEQALAAAHSWFDQNTVYDA